jgi:tetratricopeptide (TPR) repeat protein
MVRHYFKCDAIGSGKLKGFEEPVELFKLGAERYDHDKFDIYDENSARLIGRQHILDFMQNRWDAAVAGEGQVLCLHGEAGIGKSRLVHEFISLVKSDAVDTYRFYCSAQHVSMPLHPWIHNLYRWADIDTSDSNEEKREKIYILLKHQFSFPPELVQISLDLLGVSAEADERLMNSPPEQNLANLQNALISSIISSASKKPVLILVEDVQWIDATSKRGLELLIEQCVNDRIYLCVTSRVAERFVPSAANSTMMSISSLSSSDVYKMSKEIAERQDRQLSEAETDFIIRKSDGNPLFVEEVTSMVLSHSATIDAGQRVQPHAGSISPSLQSVLLSKIDSLKTGAEIAHIIAVIGRGATVELVDDITQLSRAETEAVLEELTSRNIVKCWRSGSSTIYEYRHALIRDAVYSSLVKISKERIHGDVATAMHERWSVDSEVRPETVAFHFNRAGNWKKAFGYWVLAGERAIRSGATKEAVSLLQNAQTYEKEATQNPDLILQLQRMHMAYGLALNASGSNASDPYQHFSAAAQLGEQLADSALTASALDWQFGMDFNAGRIVKSEEPARKLRKISKGSTNPVAQISCAQAWGMIYFMKGMFAEARDVFNDSLRQYPDFVSDLHCFPSMSLSYLAWSQYMLGDSKSARQSAEAAIKSAPRESPHSIATALSNCSYVYQCMGDYGSAKNCTSELVLHCNKYGELVYLRRGEIVGDWLAAVGDGELGAIDRMEANIKHLMDCNEEIELTYLYSLLASALDRHGYYGKAGEMLSLARSLANKNNETFYLAEIERLSAEFAFRIGDREVGDDGFDKAIEISELQGSLAIRQRISETQSRFC